MIREIKPPRMFVGRREQLSWLKRLLLSQRNWHRPLVVVGPSASGKTALVAQFMFLNQDVVGACWPDIGNSRKVDEFLISFDKEIRDFDRFRKSENVVVVLDDARRLDDLTIANLVRRVTNYKRVRAVIITTDRTVNIDDAPVLTLKPFGRDDVDDLLRQAATEVTAEVYDQLAIHVANNPALIGLFAGALKSGGIDELQKLFNAPLYDVTESIPRGKIVSVAKPRLIAATDSLMEELRKQPASIYQLSPRRFEELLADLLKDQGLEIELTQETRDGGRDIIARYDTPVGRILCLIEAKRYRQDRKVGVGLVRQLHGTLCDHKATSAMMVTTSTYSPDAHAYQQRHKYQLNLREYADVITWIGRYKQKASSGLILPS